MSRFHWSLHASSEITSLHTVCISKAGVDTLAPRDDVGDSWALELDRLWLRWLLFTYQLMTYPLNLTFPS